MLFARLMALRLTWLRGDENSWLLDNLEVVLDSMFGYYLLVVWVLPARNYLGVGGNGLVCLLVVTGGTTNLAPLTALDPRVETLLLAIEKRVTTKYAKLHMRRLPYNRHTASCKR